MIKDDQEKATVQNKRLSSDKPINAGISQAAYIKQLTVEISGLKTQNTLVFEHLKQITTKLDVLMAAGSASEMHGKLFDDDEVTESKQYLLDSSQPKVNNSDRDKVDN